MQNINIFVGIDLAKDTSKVCILESSGKVVLKPFSIPNNIEGMGEMLSKLKTYTHDGVIFGMEATSNYWENVLSFLSLKGYAAVLLNPYQVRKFCQALGNKIKTDTSDSVAIATLLKTKDFEEITVSTEDAINLKELVKTKYSLETRVKDCKKAILSMLNLAFPEYSQHVAHPFSKVSMHILKEYPTATHMARDGSVSRLLKIFRKYQGCNFSKDKAKALIDSARASFYSGKASPARGLSLKVHIEEIAFLQDKIAQIEAQIIAILCPKDKDTGPTDYEILNSIKGVGINTIAAFMACVGSVERFSNSAKLISYIGFYPRIFESGSYRKQSPSIQKAGPKELRYMLYLTSVASIKHNPQLRKYYLDRVSAGMPAKKALIKVAVKIAKIMYSLLKEKQVYDPVKVFYQNNICPLVA